VPVILFLKILGGIAAVGLGVFLGGSRYTQSQAEIEARMGSGKPRKAKRHFMWLNFVKAKDRASVRRRNRQPFKTTVARDKRDPPLGGPS
jgi:hypothetical protein